MKWVLLVFLCIFVFVCADDVEDKAEETSEDNVREVREYSQESWRGVEQYAEPNFDWVPHEPPPEYKPKRRRLRKRKRRPPIITQDDDTNGGEYFGERPLRRRIRPFRLQQAQEPWEEMQDEPNIRPNIRRRIIPAYNVQEETTEWEGPTFIFPSRDTIKLKTDEVRLKNENLNEENEEEIVEDNETQTQANHISDLKNLLKQSGTLSLSEILQQKNLSLSELLSGNEKAISALTEKPAEVTKRTEFSSHSSLAPHQTIKLIKDDSLKQLSVKEMPDIQKKRLANFDTATEEKFPLVTKLDVVTEAMTERRIFVPSHPKYYTSLSFKPDFDSQSERLTEPISTTTTTTTIEVPTTRSSKQKLPTTNAKLRYTLKENEENYPPVFHFPKPVQIKINEVVGIEEYKTEHTTEKPTINNDEPLRMPIDLNVIIGNAKVNTSKLQPATKIPVLNLTYVTAREEIMEVLKDPVSREKLSRILEHRNMTVDELVQQRERGSSQRHLADIFHNNSKEPEPKDEPHVAPIEGHFDPEAFKQFYERQQKSQKFEEAILKKVPEKEVVKPIEPSVKIDPFNITENKIEPIPWIGEIIPVLPTDDDVEKVNIPHFKFSTEDYFLEGIPRLETIDNAFDLSSNEEPSAEEIQSEQDTFFKIPSGVKSAIFVSLAIVGLSMVVFLTILIIFRWSQKDKRNINYCRSLSSRFRSPMILQGRPTNAIRSFVNETLGRKKNYYKNNVQRMCDDIWEGGKDMDKKLSF